MSDPIFPTLPSRNTTVQKFQAWMEAQDRGNAHKVFPSRLYSTYPTVLTAVFPGCRRSIGLT
jgi:hypothetical protein